MNNKQLEFGLRSLEADAALEALERRERSLPPHPDSPLSEKELTELAALGGDLGEEFLQTQTDNLLRAVKHGAVVAPPLSVVPAPVAQPAVPPDGGQLLPLRPKQAAPVWGSRRLRQALYAAAPLAAAAGVALWLFPSYRIDGGVGELQIAVNLDRAAEPTPAPAPTAAPLRLRIGQCVNIQIPLQESVRRKSEDLAAKAYLVKEGQMLRWNLGLQVDAKGALSTTQAGCREVPQEASEGPQELVILVGSFTRLWWHGEDAAKSGAKNCIEKFGFECVRRPLWIGPTAGGPGD